jgi:hypothetical protein
MSSQRRSYEQGHKPKCLVVVDDSAEGIAPSITQADGRCVSAAVS